MNKLTRVSADEQHQILPTHRVANDPLFIAPVTPTGPALIALLKQAVESLIALSREFLPNNYPVANQPQSFLPAFNMLDKSLASFKPSAQEKQAPASLIEKLQQYFNSSASNNLPRESLALADQLTSFFGQANANSEQTLPSIASAPLTQRSGLRS